jgi:hypothetical protein
MIKNAKEMSTFILSAGIIFLKQLHNDRMSHRKLKNQLPRRIHRHMIITAFTVPKKTYC